MIVAHWTVVLSRTAPYSRQHLGVGLATIGVSSNPWTPGKLGFGLSSLATSRLPGLQDLLAGKIGGPRRSLRLQGKQPLDLEQPTSRGKERAEA